MTAPGEPQSLWPPHGAGPGRVPPPVPAPSSSWRGSGRALLAAGCATAAVVALVAGGLVLRGLGPEPATTPPVMPSGAPAVGPTATPIPAAETTLVPVTPTPAAATPPAAAPEPTDQTGAVTLSPVLVEAGAAARNGSALRALEALAVRGRGPKTGYAREQFGQRWADVDRNGCDTRNDVLRRDLEDVVLDPRTSGCAVLTGRLDDPYTGTSVDFVRGAGSDVHVDHVVALSDAWQKGAAQWSIEQRAAFANDPVNLLGVSARANQQKGDGDAATWLPPVRAVRCAYVAAQVRVKAEYGLAVTSAEQDALRRVLSAC